MRYARLVQRWRWLIVIFWLLATVLSVTGLPSLSQVVARQNPSFLPSSASSVKASDWLQRIDPGHPQQSTALVAIADPHGLSTADLAWFRQRLLALQAQRQRDGFSFVQDAYDVPAQAATSFESHDHTTAIAIVGFPGADLSATTGRSYQTLQERLQAPPAGSRIFFTGDVPITTDNTQISLSGVSRTIAVTVVLVLLILVLILRSVVAPFVNLLTIGLSFMISSGLIAWLSRYGLPVSTFTQTFLSAILFGAGTDYSIIMLNRFREELTHPEHDGVTAIASALKAVGRTVVFSSATVMISFAVLMVARFGLYRSAAGVAIGVLVTLAACLTLVPALMAILGRSMFWPRRPVPGVAHPPSRLWAATSRMTVRHPWWTIGALILVLVPVALLFTNQRSFDTLAEIPQAPSVHGFHVVANAFGEGSVLPLQIVVKTPSNLRSPQGLAAIEAVARALAAAPRVNRVYAATRPQGKVIPSFQISYQDGKAAGGAVQIEGGLNQLATGLTTAGARIGSETQAIGSLQQGAALFTSGGNQIVSGTKTLTTSATALATGAKSLAAGSRAVTGSLGQMTVGLQQSARAAQVVAGAATKEGVGSRKLAEGLGNLSASQQQLATRASALSQALSAWAKAHPGEAASPSWQAIVAAADKEQVGLGNTAHATQQLAGAARSLSHGAAVLGQGSGQIAASLSKIGQGASRLEAAATTLSSSTATWSQGAARWSQGAGSFAKGAAAWASGGQRLGQGVGQLASGSQSLGPQLSAAGSDANKLAAGTSQLQQSLSEASQAGTSGVPGFYLPASALSQSGLQQAMNTYISANGHVAEFNVDLSINPYSGAAIAEAPTLVGLVRSTLQATAVHAPQVAATGVSAEQSDLNQISAQDFLSTMALVLTIIFILLALMQGSILAPLYILVSLTATYFVTMGIMQTAVIHLLHRTGVDWTVPFFAFLLLVALGVDYSIFLMSRFEEIRRAGAEPEDAIQEAMARMGNVVFSAAIIMAGTFGSMTLSGVTGLVEIGASVVIGLMLYTTILLGLFVPAAVAIVGGAHRWPWVKVKAVARTGTAAI